MRRLLAMFLAVLITGCASLPVDGPVTQVSPTSPIAPRRADIAPGPPLPDASPEQLITGFLVAMAAGGQGVDVARSYLTSSAAHSWHPEDGGIDVYEGTHNPPIATTDSARIDAPLVGRISTRGHFLADSGRVSHDFGLVKENGQWRINHPPRGILVSNYIFNRYFDAYPVYFFNDDHLAPELVHLPSSQVSPSQLLARLLAGPSERLSGAVTTMVPKGTILNKASIDDQGVAQVDLSTHVESLNVEDRRRLGAQILWTLTAFPRVTSVAITVGQQPFPIPGQSAVGDLDLANLQGFQVLAGPQSDDLFAVSGGRLGRVSESAEFLPVQGTFAAADANLSMIALSLDAATVAATKADGTVLIGTPNDVVRTVPTGLTELARPQVLLGATWILGRDVDGASRLIRVDESGAIAKVPVVDFNGRLMAFRISPDGTRIALVADRAGDKVLLMGTITRTEAGFQVGGLLELRPIVDGARLSGFADVGWAGETSIVILASPVASPGRLAYTVRADGTGSASIGPMGIYDLQQISVLPRRSGLRAAVVNGDARLLRYDARARWQGVNIAGIATLSYPG